MPTGLTTRAGGVRPQGNPTDRATSGAQESDDQGWMGRPATMGCGTDDEAQRRYRAHLATAGLRVVETRLAYTDALDLDQLVGGVLSAFSSAMLPHGEQRQHFRDGLRDAVGNGPFQEAVDVGLLFGLRE
jgi:hypothetical protein